MKEVLYGIDLGTTNSLICKFENGRIVTFKNPIGLKDTLASVVGFRKDRILVGDKAREYLLKDPSNVISAFKRKMGTDKKYYIPNIDENVTPIELSSYVIKELMSFVPEEKGLNAAVITIPASFDTNQSNATQQAAHLANIKEVFLLQEPIAAGVAFMNENRAVETKEGYWMVYDLGGGTYDSAIIKVNNGELSVVGHDGNNFLGGVDFDFKIVKEIILPKILNSINEPDFETEFFKQHGKYEKTFLTLLLLAEEAKKELSVAETTEVEFEIGEGRDSIAFSIEISRKEFEAVISDLVEETILTTQNLLQETALSASQISQIILVGGSTLVPYLRKRLSESFGIAINNSLDPTTIVALGAAYYASSKLYNDEKYTHNSAERSEEGNRDSVAPSKSLIPIVFNATSMDEEEILLIKPDDSHSKIKHYRVFRLDGGFDTGYMPLKEKNICVLPLMEGVNNKFEVKFYHQDLTPAPEEKRDFIISQGLYNITGQPLPKDICLEVDDLENNCTKLEPIFIKNSILPQKKTLYRQISKYIKKGSDDCIIINILEGDKNTRPVSNLPIGKIEISGKDLSSDLIQNSDIELSFYISESRILEVKLYLAMADQEFSEVFSFSERTVSLKRLKQHAHELQLEIVAQINEFRSSGQIEFSEELEALMFDLKELIFKINEISEDYALDSIFQMAEKLQDLSKKFDHIGGDMRLNELRMRYLHCKEKIQVDLQNTEVNQFELNQQFNRILHKESIVLKSKSPNYINNAINELLSFADVIASYSFNNLCAVFTNLKNYGDAIYNNPKAAHVLFEDGERAIENRNVLGLRQIINSLINVSHYANMNLKMVEDNIHKSSTGIG